jgi:FkbH-like protein
MFEFDKYDRGLHKAPMISPPNGLLPPQQIERAALLIWGEHCTECAAPDCFKSCDLYVARPDGRCRRMPFGMAPNHAIAGSRGPGAEVVFGKWAKLEARGNVRLVPNSTLRLAEKMALQGARGLDFCGGLLAKMVGQDRWKYLSFALGQRLMDMLRRHGGNGTPDGFLIDIFNPGQQTAELTLAITVSAANHVESAAAELPRPFLRRVVLKPGNNRELIAYREFRDVIECRLPFNVSLTPDSNAAYHLVVRTLDLVKLSAQERARFEAPTATVTDTAQRASAAKCVVFDLDNTLWQGVLLETDQVRLLPQVLPLLRELDQRGILLTIASKNTHDHALAKLSELGIEEYFIFPRINWGPKSENIRQIAKDIDIGLDTFVFVDDNPFELEEVGQTLPMVECVDALKLAQLAAHPRLQGSASAEARERRKMYRDAMVRTQAQASFGDDYIAFLRSCQIRLVVRPDRQEDFERIAELVQRTNQLNFSGHKYRREEIFKLFNDASLGRYVLICEDKFGRYGTVGFCMARRNGPTVKVVDFMLSCRVQGKFIESALFDYLCKLPAAHPATAIEVNFTRTQRNAPAQQVLAKLGFDVTQDGCAQRPVAPDTFSVDFIRVSAE